MPNNNNNNKIIWKMMIVIILIGNLGGCDRHTHTQTSRMSRVFKKFILFFHFLRSYESRKRFFLTFYFLLFNTI